MLFRSNNRPANHRARAGNIRKDQVTDQTGPENINILERRHRADHGDAVSLGDAHSATVKIAPASNSSHQSVACSITQPWNTPCSVALSVADAGSVGAGSARMASVRNCGDS